MYLASISARFQSLPRRRNVSRAVGNPPAAASPCGLAASARDGMKSGMAWEGRQERSLCSIETRRRLPPFRCVSRLRPRLQCRHKDVFLDALLGSVYRIDIKSPPLPIRSSMHGARKYIVSAATRAHARRVCGVAKKSSVRPSRVGARGACFWRGGTRASMQVPRARVQLRTCSFLLFVCPHEWRRNSPSASRRPSGDARYSRGRGKVSRTCEQRGRWVRTRSVRYKATVASPLPPPHLLITTDLLLFPFSQ